MVSTVFLENRSSIQMTLVHVHAHGMIPAYTVNTYIRRLAGQIACSLRSGCIHETCQNELGRMHKRSEIRPDAIIMLKSSEIRSNGIMRLCTSCR